MQLEIQVALNFIISYLYNKLPRRRVNIFGEELERQLKQKYAGHWYPDTPCRGSAFRCLHVGEKVDPVVERAARESGLDLQDVRHNLPQELSVWIDPCEVSYQMGEKGAVKVLYVDEGGPELDKEVKSSFNPEAQVFLPISEAVTTPASSPSPPFGQPASSPSFLRPAQPLTFTTASFAATKFGSTKMKSGGRGKVSRGSPTPPKQMYPPPALSALSPDAKEFVLPGDTPSYALDVLAGLSESLSFGLQYSNQQFQPVMAI